MGAKRMEPSMLMSFLPGTREMWVLKLLDRGQRRFKCRLEFDKLRQAQCENPDVVPYFHN
jgi:hypothetical protein